MVSNSVCRGSLLAFALFLFFFLFFRSVILTLSILTLSILFIIFLYRLDRLLSLFYLHRAAPLFFDKLRECALKIYKAVFDLFGDVNDGLVLLLELVIHLL